MRRLSPCLKNVRFGLIVLVLVSGSGFGPLTTRAFAQATPKSDDGQSTEIPSLTLDKPIERELRRGETHAYTVALNKGQYLQIHIRQIQFDVAVFLFGPTGETLVETDNTGGFEGGESVCFIAETTGIHRLQIKSAEKEAKTGRYEVRVDLLRIALPQDAERVAAQKLLDEAVRLLDEKTKESSRKAIAKLEEAALGFQRGGDQDAEASVWDKVGTVHDDLGDKDKALECYTRALPLARAVKNRHLEGDILNNFGLTHSDLGDKQKAIALFEQALAPLRETGDRSGEAATLNNIGLAYRGLGETRKALEYYAKALPILQSVGNKQVEATTISNIGVAYSTIGENQKALDHYQKALEMMRALGDLRGQARMLFSIGFIYSELGERETSRNYLNQSLELRRKIGDRRGEASTLNSLAFHHLDDGDFEKSAEVLNQALELWQAVGDRHGQALTLTNLGKVASKRRDERAEAYYSRALSLRRASGNRNDIARTLTSWGESLLSSGETERASAALTEALTLGHETEDRELEAETAFYLAVLERERGNLDGSRQNITRAIDLIEFVRTNYASRELRTSYFAVVKKYYDFYVDLLMRIDKANPSRGFDKAALEANEKARARVLLEMLSENRADIRQGVGAELLARERGLRERINDKASRLTQLKSGNTRSETTGDAQRELDDLITEYRQIQTEIRQKNPRYASLTQPSALSVEEIQRFLLDADTILLEYALGEKHGHVWVVTPSEVVHRELPSRADIERAVLDVRDLLRAETRPPSEGDSTKSSKSFETAATKLSRMVLGPIAEHLGDKRLLIVADGALQYVPFGALPIPETGGSMPKPRKGRSFHPLILDHEIVSLPSISVLALLRKDTAGRASATKQLAVFADPVFSPNDPRVKGDQRVSSVGPTESTNQIAALRNLTVLKSTGSKTGPESADPRVRIPRLLGTRREASEIRSLVSPSESETALDFAASRDRVLGADLDQFRIIHFATHGVLNTEHPELSGLILSLVNRQGEKQNGVLLTSDVYNLNLNADLVVLSACETGLGKSVKGEGMVGLTRGFMYAGAPRVVVSLWSVGDRATADLMVSFYKGMLREKLTPAAALRKAQIELWKSRKWNSPYYWAAFQLQGEYR